MFHLILMFFWVVIFIATLTIGVTNQKDIVIFIFILSVFQFIGVWSLATKRHAYDMSPLHVFLLFSFLFFSVMPSLSILLDYHFVIKPSDTNGIVKLLMTNFIAMYAFCAGYIFIIGNTQENRMQVRSDSIIADDYARINTIWAFLAGIIGVISFLIIYFKIGSFDGLRYEQIGVALRGNGWLLRMAELLALGGVILFFTAVRINSKKLVLAAISLLVLYVMLRYPFQNRENVIKYFVMMFLMYLYSNNVKINPIKMLLLGVGFLAIMLFLPLLSLLRGGEELWSSYSLTYIDFFFRDFNFSEVVSALYAREDLSGVIGIYEGSKNIALSLIPRQIYPDKPYPLAVIITSYVTTIFSYDVKDPYFSYGTGYMGMTYAMGGVFFVVAFATVLGGVSGLLMKMFRNKLSTNYRVEYVIITGIIIYYMTVSIHKLDLANIVTAMVIPLMYLWLMLVVGKIKIK